MNEPMFPDPSDAQAHAGPSTIVQRMRDEVGRVFLGQSAVLDQVIAACDDRGLAMILTGVRHFRH